MSIDLRTVLPCENGSGQPTTESRKEILKETVGSSGENKEDGARFLTALEDVSGSGTTMSTHGSKGHQARKTQKGKEKRKT